MAKKLSVLILRIDVKLKKQLSEISEKQNKSAGEYVRRLIEDAVKIKKQV